MRKLLAAVIFLIPAFAATTTHAASPSQPALDPASFVTQQFRHPNGVLSFDDNCPGNPTSGLASQGDDAPEQLRPSTWQVACRQVTTKILLQILGSVPPGGTLLIEGANFTADATDKNNRIELGNQSFPIRLQIAYSRFAERLYASGAHFISLNINNTDFAGPFNAEYLTTDDFLRLDNDHLKDLADLNHVRVGSYFELSSVYGDSTFSATDSTISGNLLMQHKIAFRSMAFNNSAFGRSFVLGGLQLSGSLSCRRCVIADNLSFSVAGSAIATNTISGPVDFSQSNITDGIAINSSNFSDQLDLDNLDTSNIGIVNSTVKKTIWANYDSVSGVFLLDNVNLQSLALAGATIGKILDISALSTKSWPAKGGNLDLTDATVSAFTDCSASWPATVELDGFHYNSIGTSSPVLGAINPASTPCSRIGGSGKHSSDQGWLAFLAKNTDNSADFDPQPYTFLAKYFSDAGNKQYANDILYRSRQLEMQNAWATGHWYEAIGLTILYVIAGFGIGDHAFWHILGTVGLSVGLAVFVIRYSEQARAFGVLWCIGACVERLLPIVELDKQFSNFFDDPDKDPANPKLAGWQHAFFAIYALWGWFVGLLLAAVLSGLTQTS